MATTIPVVRPTTQVLNDTRRAARRGLTLFFAILVPLSVLFETLAIQTQNALWIFIVMWVPAFASLVARLALREGPSDISFRLGGRRGLRALGLAFILPAIICGVAYGLAWGLGLAGFVLVEHPMVAALTGGSTAPLVVMSVQILLAMTLGLIGSGVGAIGEEIGWRGYMLTRLIDAGVPAPILTSGLIWALWHTPLILAGQYAAGPSAALSALLFLVAATASGVIHGQLRLRSGSIWPPILLHSVWNSVAQNVFDRAISGSNATIWVGESGILVALVLVAVAVTVSRGRGPIVRSLPQPVAEQANA